MRSISPDAPNDTNVSLFLSSLSLSLSLTGLYKSTQIAQVFHCKSPYQKKSTTKFKSFFFLFSLQIYSHVSGTPHQIPLLFLLFSNLIIVSCVYFSGYFCFFFMFDITCMMGLCGLTCSVSLWISYSFRDLVWTTLRYFELYSLMGWLCFKDSANPKKEKGSLTYSTVCLLFLEIIKIGIE